MMKIISGIRGGGGGQGRGGIEGDLYTVNLVIKITVLKERWPPQQEGFQLHGLFQKHLPSLNYSEVERTMFTLLWTSFTRSL